MILIISKWAAVNIFVAWENDLYFEMHETRDYTQTPLSHLRLHWGSLVSVNSEVVRNVSESHLTQTALCTLSSLNRNKSGPSWFISPSVPTFDYLLISMSASLCLFTNNSNMLQCQSVRNVILGTNSLNSSVPFGEWLNIVFRKGFCLQNYTDRHSDRQSLINLMTL